MKALIQEAHLIHSTDYVGSFKTDRDTFSIWWRGPGIFIIKDHDGITCDYIKTSDINKMLIVLGYEEITRIPNRESVAA